MKTLEDLCSPLTIAEIQQMIFARWSKNSNEAVTTINYTFNRKGITDDVTNHMLGQMRTDIQGSPLMESLSHESRQIVKATLEQWVYACNQKIRFNYVANLSPDQPGIAFVGCDYLKEAVGVAAYNFMEVPDQILLNKVLVCLPTDLQNPFASRTASHEIGHSLGLLHLHEVESLKQRIMTTEQGLGCSVMGYNHELWSEINACTTSQYCANETYAIVPGPIDSQICTQLYDYPASSFLSPEKYQNSVFLGIFNGAFEKALSSLLMHIEIQSKKILDKNTANSLASVSTALMNSYLLGTNFMSVHSFIVLELTAQLYKNEHIEIIHLLRTLINIANRFMSLYQLYANDDAFSRSVYLAAFLAGNLAGSLVGSSVGEKLAQVSNSLFQYLPEVTTKLTSLGNWFFSKKPEKEPIAMESLSMESRLS